MATLHDVMATAPMSIAPQATVADAAATMVQGRVGSLLVRAEGEGTVVGILTERDVLRAAGAGGDLLTTRVSDWMTRDPATAAATQDVEEGLRTMLAGGFRHLPVTDGGEVIGIVSLRDLVGADAGAAARPTRLGEAAPADPAPTASPSSVQQRRTQMFEATRELQRCGHAEVDDEQGWRDRLGAAAAVLDEVVATHIAETEGPDRFFDELVRESSGRLSGAVRRLRRDHVRSRELVRDLREAIDARAEPAMLRQDADELFAQLEAHRHRGSDLLWQAYGVTIGVGD